MHHSRTNAEGALIKDDLNAGDFPQAKTPAPFEPEYAAPEGGKISGMTKEYSGWDVYNNEAKKVDTELVKDWTASLNFLLLFAAIFAAVLTAFIIESKKLLEPDQGTILVDTMMFFMNTVANGTHIPYARPEFEAPSFAITINSLFFASLSASLIAALASVIALQWVADYDAAITRGGSSPEDRAKRRQFRYAGVVWWKMSQVIAALPLLLYFAVILFFAGLILWMWIIHRTVGLVVAGGAGVAILFYGVSTLLAVAFVSAPFRTPLSRWIYKLCHLPFCALYWSARALHIPAIAWLKRRHLLYKTSHKRVDKAVNDEKELARDAFVWLANHISTCQESYRRLVLLMSELPKLAPEYKPSFAPAEAPWDFILDLIGGTLLNHDLIESLTPGARRHRAIMEQVYTKIRGVQDLVFPGIRHHYVNDTEGSGYWDQYCDPGVRSSHGGTERDIPNRLFLLLRDVPRPYESAPEEIEATILFSHWRNSWPKRVRPWEEIFDLADSFSPAFLSSCVDTLSTFVRLQIWYEWEDNDVEQWRSTLRKVVEISARHGILSKATVSLVQAYESLTVGLSNCHPSASCVSKPLRYGQDIRLEDEPTHNRLILLLARQLCSSPSHQRAMRIKEVITMLWLRPSNTVSKNWEDFKAAHIGTDPISLNSQDVIDWVKDADKVPQITEILGHLSKAQLLEPSVGSLWRATVTESFFVEALQAFDRLMGPECSPSDHCTIVDLVCQDLELEEPGDPEHYFTASRIQVLSQVGDLCLQILGNCARGADYLKPALVPDKYGNQWSASLDRVARFVNKRYRTSKSHAILELQAGLLPRMCGEREIFREALRESSILSVFQYPVSCKRCLDGPGHLLFHLLDAVPIQRFVEEPKVATAVPLRDQWLPIVLIIIHDWFSGSTVRLRKYIEPAGADEQCLLQLDSILGFIKISEYHRLTLIWNVSQRLERSMEEQSTVRPEELAAILSGIQGTLQLGQEPESTRILAPLSQSIERLARSLETQTHVGYAARKAVLDETARTSQRLLGSLATRLIFGRENARLLSCACAGVDVRPAIGWLPPYGG